MNEQYINFNTAQLLKEKGFDWPTIEYYSSNGGIYRFTDGIADICGFLSYPRPTQQMARDWLEEKYGFFIEIGRSIDLNGTYHYAYLIFDKTCKYIYNQKDKNNDFLSSYDAANAALELCLENFI